MKEEDFIKARSHFGSILYLKDQLDVMENILSANVMKMYNITLTIHAIPKKQQFESENEDSFQLVVEQPLIEDILRQVMMPIKKAISDKLKVHETIFKGI